MTTKTILPDDVREMQLAIGKITGRPVVSFNRRYLQIRLASLRRMSPDELPKNAPPEQASGRNISFARWRSDLVDRMALKAFGGNASALVSKAVDEYAVRHGFGADVARGVRALK